MENKSPVHLNRAHVELTPATANAHSCGSQDSISTRGGLNNMSTLSLDEVDERISALCLLFRAKSSSRQMPDWTIHSERISNDTGELCIRRAQCHTYCVCFFGPACTLSTPESAHCCRCQLQLMAGPDVQRRLDDQFHRRIWSPWLRGT
jgi:hypothetical protein